MVSFHGKFHRASDADRFEAQFTPEPTSGCWLWLGSTTPNGYGLMKSRGKKGRLAHRFALEEATGKQPPPTIFACHRCDNRGCVNPAHLFWGTHTDNVRDMESKGRAVHPAGDANPLRANPRLAARGERHGRTKFGADAAECIRQARAQGVKLKALAERYGVTMSCISRIGRGTSWKP